MDLFSPYRWDGLDLANRMVVAPMTRSRALGGNIPNPVAATYYEQRASAGLIITEGTQVSPQGSAISVPREFMHPSRETACPRNPNMQSLTPQGFCAEIN